MALHKITEKGPLESHRAADRTVMLDNMLKQCFRLVSWGHAIVGMGTGMEVSNSYSFHTQ